MVEFFLKADLLSFNRYNILHTFKIYNLIILGLCITRETPCNQNNKHIHHPQNSLPLVITLHLPVLHPMPRQPLICFLPLYILLQFLEFDINGITKYTLWTGFFHSVYYFEFNPIYCVYQEFIPFYYRLVFHFMNSLFSCLWWTFEFLPVFGFYK